MGFGAQGRHLKGDRTAWEGNVSVQFSSVQPSSVQFFVTSRAVAVHFIVGEGSVLFVSFSSQFSSVRFIVQLSSINFSSVQFNSVQLITVQGSSVHAVQFRAIQFSSVQYI